MPLLCLIFELGSWGLGIAAIKKPKRNTALVMGSFFTISISVVCEFLIMRMRVYGGDFGAIEDTIDAYLAIVIFKLAVTLLLNLAALILRDLEHQPNQSR